MPKPRAALYARYSSDLQNPQSIEDQYRLCRQLTVQMGWEVVALYSDEAASAASLHGREGLSRLLHDAGEGRFDIVCAEALDRVSRDQADTAHVYKLLRFHGVALHTPSGGQVDELQIGLRGTMNALFLKDLADKTRRGQRGRIEIGRSGGGIAYGYNIAVLEDGAAGAREINEREAMIVRRIFRAFAEGDNPAHIAEQLNREGVPGPRGCPWRATTIRGHVPRGTGILNNELYRGVLIWNRLRYVKDPRTGRRQARFNPESEWVRRDIPVLRIVDDPLWESVKVRQLDVKQRSAAVREGVQRTRLARSRGLIAQSSIFYRLLICGRCGSDFFNVGRERYGCSAHYQRSACDNGETVSRITMEEKVQTALRRLTAMLVRQMDTHSEDTDGDLRGRRIEAERRQLEDIDSRAHYLTAAIEDGLYTPLIKIRLQQLEQQAARLRANLALLKEEAARPVNEEARVLQSSVEELIFRIQRNDEQAAVALRTVVGAIRVTPGNKRGACKFALTFKPSS